MTLRQRRKQVVLLAAPLLLLFGYNNCSGGFASSTQQQSASSLGSDDNTGAGSSSTSSSSSSSGSTSSGSSTPTPTPAPAASNLKTVFMVVGHMGRTAFSCDDGVTWIHDRSDNDAVRCWDTSVTPYVDCDHTASSATISALDYGDGWFYAQFGWGYDGAAKKSQDGVNWQTIRSPGWGGGIVYSNKTIFSDWEYDWKYSLDGGATWLTPTIPSATMYDNIDHPLPVRLGNKLFEFGRPGSPITMVTSTDNGMTWKTSSGFPGANKASIAEGNGVIVVLDSYYPSSVMRSADGGLTWTSKAVAGFTDIDMTNVLFDGTQFVAFTGQLRWTSPNGVNWTSAKKVGNFWYGPVAYDPNTKTYVAIASMWDNYYAKQKAYRSTDGGLTWVELDTNHFKGGHPVSKIVVGQMDGSACK